VNIISEKPPLPASRDGNQIALWAGVAAFFASVLAIGTFDLLDVEGWTEMLSAVVISLFTAGAVYAKERLDNAKRVAGRGPK
jgi:uncharacterized membrane protein (DUF2068 family)